MPDLSGQLSREYRNGISDQTRADPLRRRRLALTFNVSRAIDD